MLRIQREVHASVAQKAFEVRSQEIAQEVPPVSATELTASFRQVMGSNLKENWELPGTLSAYQVLEVLPSATLKMVQQVFRVIALQVHPDANPARLEWANEMMKRVNAAYEAVAAEKKANGSSG